MRARRIDDVRAWRDVTTPLLVTDEARHNLMLGLSDILTRHPGWYTSWHLWVVEEDRTIVLASLQTPPHNVVLSREERDGAVDTLTDAMLRANVLPPGVTAALPEAEAMADAWIRRVGGRWRTALAQAVYSLETVRRVPHPEGRTRPAGTTDRGLLLRWVRAFSEEVNPHRPLEGEQLRRTVDERLSQTDPDAGFAVWETPDHEVTSISGFGGLTPNGVRIGPVYTPPELRGRGYATALVADLSADLLASGRRFCFLHTDLANPTSNAIYRRIGYEPVCESAEIVFED
jgi:GNAT superfamily N-acetyltransferase